MWKYIDQQQCNAFLLSLGLMEDQKDQIRKLYGISNHIESNYKSFKIQKQGGGFRTIYEPAPLLKYIQRQILHKILNSHVLSEYATAYRPKTGLAAGSAPHINKKFILKLDIRSFFDSIGLVDVYKACFPIAYFPPQVGMLLAVLCTYNDRLPQGSPASPAISNIVMKPFDEELGEWCKLRNITYTRYSDDMTFSGDFLAGEVIKKVRKMLYRFGMELNDKKTHRIGQNSRQCVTGITVNEKLQLSSEYRRKIRQEVYYIKKFGIDSHMNHTSSKDSPLKYLSRLQGKISFVLQVNPGDAEFIEYRAYVRSLNPSKQKTAP